MCLASPLRFQAPEKKICAEAPNVKDQLPSPRCDPTLWRLWRGGGEKRMQKCLCQAKRATGGQFIGRNMLIRRVIIKGFKLFDEGPEKKKEGKKKNTTGSVQGFIFWTVKWRRSRYRGRCRSPSSCWRFAAGGGRSSAMMPDLSRCGRPPAMFHSSGLFAGGPCCLIHARSFSLAWRRA